MLSKLSFRRTIVSLGYFDKWDYSYRGDDNKKYYQVVASEVGHLAADNRGATAGHSVGHRRAKGSTAVKVSLQVLQVEGEVEDIGIGDACAGGGCLGQSGAGHKGKR